MQTTDRYQTSPTTLLLMVEGVNDAEFLRRISTTLAAADSALPNLKELERQGDILFVPFGGGNLVDWGCRFAPLRCAEFHLYDREVAAEAATREQAAQIVNSRPGCRAVITSRRSLENYLHPEAIVDARNLVVRFNDRDCVPMKVAETIYQCTPHGLPWGQLPTRTRRRLANRAKHWLNREAVDCMSRDRLAVADPDHDIEGWLMTIASLMRGSL